jgi:OOP family OmpA-OmpF porin
MGKQRYLQQLGTILAPDPEQEKKMEQALEKSCRAPVYGIYFESASAAVNPASRPTLQQIAGVMQRHADWTLTIEGHTDSIGGAASNLDLSNRRAAAVKTELTSRFGVAATRLATKGYGLTRPIETNATIEGRARNRRVELVRACK